MSKILIGETVTSDFVDTPCWIWQAKFDRYGYGYMQMQLPKRTKKQSHRVSMMIFKPAENIEGLHVCHSCHNRKCVNPAHLHGGTSLENIRETMQAGNHVYGEAQHMAKLKESDIVDIREKFNQGQSRADLAKEYDVTWSNINNIVKNLIWKTYKIIYSYRGLS